MRLNGKAWDKSKDIPRSVHLQAIFSLLLWAVVIISGRMIAYNWFDCDKQPQPEWVNWAAGCVIEISQAGDF